MVPYHVAALLALTSAGLVVAQDQQITWSSVAMTLHGERTADISDAYPNLTPLGARQALAAGSVIRNRYIQGFSNNVTSFYPIHNLAVNEIDNTQLFILAADLDYTAASSQAFMQGVYPPLGVLYVDSESILANNTVVQYPIGGYQYPTIDIISPLDYNYVWISGDTDCNQYVQSANNYLTSQDYNTTANASLPFYQRIAPIVFQNVLPSSLVNYHNAYNLWDYANYQFIHNRTVADNLDPSDLELLRNYASQHEFGRNGNLSASGLFQGDEIRAISGQTYGGAVLDLLGQAVQTHGEGPLLSMLFGRYPVFMAFFALSGLSQHSDNFKSIPEPGSMMVFELFSKNPNVTSFPSQNDLWVRFLFRNGTDPSTPLIAYPLFGRGESATDMSWIDFVYAIEKVCLTDIVSWCLACSSLAMYCGEFIDNRSNATSGDPSTGSSTGSSHGLNSTVAGVIGAVVTLAVVTLFLAVAILCFGVRIYRNGNKRQSSLGGFKGAEKLASDTDLTVAKGAAGASIVRHERVGSWELSDANKTSDGGSTKTPGSMDRVVSMADYSKKDDDAISIVNPYTEPVKADERV